MQRLKTLVASDDLIVAPVALNPIMARMAEEAGFRAVNLSGGLVVRVALPRGEVG